MVQNAVFMAKKVDADELINWLDNMANELELDFNAAALADYDFNLSDEELGAVLRK